MSRSVVNSMKLKQLQDAFHKLAPSPLTPAEKARILLTEVTQQTLTLIVENRAIFTSLERRTFLRTLATNLKDHWIPPGLSEADMELIPLDWMIGMVTAVANGTGVGGYELKVYERFTQTLDLSVLPEPERGEHPVAGRRAYPRRRVP